MKAFKYLFKPIYVFLLTLGTGDGSGRSLVASSLEWKEEILHSSYMYSNTLKVCWEVALRDEKNKMAARETSNTHTNIIRNKNKTNKYTGHNSLQNSRKKYFIIILSWYLSFSSSLPVFFLGLAGAAALFRQTKKRSGFNYF